MAILTMVLAILSALMAVPLGGIYLMLSVMIGRSPGPSYGFAAAVALVALLDLGAAGLACWQAFHGMGGLLAALSSLSLSALMARAGAGLAHAAANP